MEEVTNLLEFAIEDSTLSYDLDDRPIIDKNKLVDMLNDIINRRENALKHRIKREAQEAIKKVLQEF
jgi:hypothetical protein